MAVADFADTPTSDFAGNGREQHHLNARFPLSVIVVSATINILGLALPLVILQVYDRVLTNHAYSTLAWLIAGLVTVVAAETVLKIIRSYLLSWFAIRVAYLSDSIVGDNILSTPTRDLERDSTGSWMDKFEALQQYNAFASSQSRLALADLPFIALYLAVIYIVAGPLAIAVITIAIFFTIAFTWQTRKIKNILAQRAELDQRRYDFIGETLAGIEAIKSMAMEPQMERRLERLQKQSAAVAYRKNLLSNNLTTTTSFMIGIMMVAVVTTGAAMVLNGDLSIGTLACATLLTSRLAQLIVRCIPVVMERQTSQFAKARAGSLFQVGSDSHDRDHEAGCARLAGVDGHVQLKDIRFSYEGDDRVQITIDDLEIRPGEAIGIRGGRSTGKSTLLKIIAGELVAQSGAVLVDGHDIHGPHRIQLKGRIRFVRNVPQIFTGTILENISMFEEGDAVVRARAAARAIGLDNAVNQLPNGIQTQIGNGAGTVLPAGILQQIAIARALAAQPKVLLFDEANTSLDLRADQLLTDELAGLGGQVTRIYITNRPSLLKTADRVFEFRDGRLIPVEAQN